MAVTISETEGGQALTKVVGRESGGQVSPR